MRDQEKIDNLWHNTKDFVRVALPNENDLTRSRVALKVFDEMWKVLDAYDRLERILGKDKLDAN